MEHVDRSQEWGKFSQDYFAQEEQSTLHRGKYNFVNDSVQAVMVERRRDERIPA